MPEKNRFKKKRIFTSIGILVQNLLGQAAFSPFLILSDRRIILKRKPSPNFLKSPWSYVVASQPIVSNASFWNSWIQWVGSSTGNFLKTFIFWFLKVSHLKPSWAPTMSVGSQPRKMRIFCRNLRKFPDFWRFFCSTTSGLYRLAHPDYYPVTLLT